MRPAMISAATRCRASFWPTSAGDDHHHTHEQRLELSEDTRPRAIGERTGHTEDGIVDYVKVLPLGPAERGQPGADVAHALIADRHVVLPLVLGPLLVPLVKVVRELRD